MHLSFGMGVFWLFIAWAAGDTIVKTAQALGKRSGSRKDTADLERRVHDLEQRVADQAELIEAREQMLVRLEEKVEFTDRLLASRTEKPAAAGAKAPPAG